MWSPHNPHQISHGICQSLMGKEEKLLALIVANKGTENEKVTSLVGQDYSYKGMLSYLCENTRKFLGTIYGLC